VRDSRRSRSFTQISDRKRHRVGRDAAIIGVDTPRLDADGRRSGENRLRTSPPLLNTQTSPSKRPRRRS
jgi:hypothetical protein